MTIQSQLTFRCTPVFVCVLQFFLDYSPRFLAPELYAAIVSPNRGAICQLPAASSSSQQPHLAHRYLSRWQIRSPQAYENFVKCCSFCINSFCVWVSLHCHLMPPLDIPKSSPQSSETASARQWAMVMGLCWGVRDTLQKSSQEQSPDLAQLNAPQSFFEHVPHNLQGRAHTCFPHPRTLCSVAGVAWGGLK